MSALERRYRRLLWLLPARYRHAYGDELIGLLLDLGSDRTRPSAAEVFSVVTLAVRLRLREPAGWPRLTASIVLTAALIVAGTRQAGLLLVLLPDGMLVLPLPSYDVLLVGRTGEFGGALVAALSIPVVSLLAPLAFVLGARRTALILYLGLFGSQVLLVTWTATPPVPLLWNLWPLAALAALWSLPAVRPRALWAALVPLAALTWAGVAEAMIVRPAGWIVAAIFAICAAAVVGRRRGWAVLAATTVASGAGGWVLSALSSHGPASRSTWFWSSQWPSLSQWLLVAVVVTIGAVAQRYRHVGTAAA